MSDLQRRTEQLLQSNGYLTASVEKRKRFPDPKARKCAACGTARMLDIASDMWGVFDLIALRRIIGADFVPEFLFVQVTSSANHAARRKKILASAEAKICILAGARVLIQAWRKKDNRWQSQDEWISSDQFVSGLPSSPGELYEARRKEKLDDLPPGVTLPLSPMLEEETPF